MTNELVDKLTKITRYDLEDTSRSWDVDRNMVERPDGDWIKVEDLATAIGLWYGYVRAEGYKLRLEAPVYDD